MMREDYFRGYKICYDDSEDGWRANIYYGNALVHTMAENQDSAERTLREARSWIDNAELQTKNSSNLS